MRAAEIPLFKVAMDAKDLDVQLSEVLHSGWIGQGQKVAELEAALADRFDNPRVLCLSAGTHGLSLALRLVGVGPDDEVISTPLTCTATNMPIVEQRANIVWADVGGDLNIDPESVRERISDQTRAIIVVHWGGYPCDMREIAQIASEAGGIPIIEDCAHAYGATYQGATVGACTHSDFAMFSFQAIKHLTTADGGALCGRRNGDFQRGRLLRWFGIDRERPDRDRRGTGDIAEWGYKFHMNDVCATIGLCNLTTAERNIGKAIDNAQFYQRALAPLDGVTLTQTKTDRQSSCWLFTMLVDGRDEFCRMMDAKGIAVGRVHERNDRYSCFGEFARELPGLDAIDDRLICIPVGWWVSEEDRHYIAQSIKGGW